MLLLLLCCAVLCCAVLCCAVLCCAVLCCAVRPVDKHLVRGGSSWSRMGMIDVSSLGVRQSLNDISKLLKNTASKLLPGGSRCSGIICISKPASSCK